MGNNNGAVSAAKNDFYSILLQPAQNANDIEYNRVGPDNQAARNVKNKKKVHAIKNQSNIKKETIKLVRKFFKIHL